MSESAEIGNVRIEEIGDFADRVVRLRGWLYQKRSSGKLHFLQLRDGTGIIQCIAGRGDVSDALFDELAATARDDLGCEIEFAGTLRRVLSSEVRVEAEYYFRCALM